MDSAPLHRERLVPPWWLLLLLLLVFPASLLVFLPLSIEVGIGVAAVLYPILWKAADWDPRFLDVMVTALQETPPTRNRGVHGGDSYAQ